MVVRLDDALLLSTPPHLSLHQRARHRHRHVPHLRRPHSRETMRSLTAPDHSQHSHYARRPWTSCTIWRMHTTPWPTLTHV